MCVIDDKGEEDGESEEDEEEVWNSVRAEETAYSIDTYKETQARKMTWESIRKGVTPTFLVEGTNEDVMDIKQQMEAAEGTGRLGSLSETPYSIPLGAWTQGEGMVMSPGNAHRLTSSNNTRLFGSIGAKSSPSPSQSPSSSPSGGLGRRRKRDSPLRTLKRGYSLNSDGTLAATKSGEYKSSKLNVSGGSGQVKQYYLIEEEDANSTRTSKNREKIQRRKGNMSLSKALLKSRMESSIMEHSVKGALAVSAPMITGSIAEMLMGKPSMESMRGIAMSSSSPYNSKTVKEGPRSPEMVVGKVETVKKNMLSLSHGPNRGAHKKRKRSNEDGHTFSSSRKYVPDIDRHSLEFKQRYLSFTTWVEENTLVNINRLAPYIESVKTIMNDLIFNSNKRKSMQLAYGIASMVNTADTVKRKMTTIERGIRSIREEEQKALKALRKKYKRSFVDFHFSPTLYIRDYYERNKEELGPSAQAFMEKIDDAKGEDSVDERKKLDFMESEEDFVQYKYGRRTQYEWSYPSLGKGINIPAMTYFDDIYADNMQKDHISSVPHNAEKERKYANEIVRLWVILLSCENVRMTSSPKSQFDHFVLGVLYLLTNTDIVIGDRVVMEKDLWLKENLPSQKRLCENYINKLKRKDVARVLQRNTDLDENMLKFSTRSRSYTSKIVTKGCTRVKEWVKDYNGNQDMDAFCTFLRENSVVEYIHVGKTMGNTNTGRRRTYNSGRTALFK